MKEQIANRSRFERMPETARLLGSKVDQRQSTGSFEIIEESNQRHLISSAEKLPMPNQHSVILNDSSLPKILIVHDNTFITPNNQLRKNAVNHSFHFMQNDDSSKSNSVGREIKIRDEFPNSRISNVQTSIHERDDDLNNVLTIFSATKKKQEYLHHLKSTLKKAENPSSIIKGKTTKNKNLSDANVASLQSALKVNSSLNHGRDLLSSDNQNDLIENLRAPFRNPLKSPLAKLSQISQKNDNALQQMDSMMAYIKPTDRSLDGGTPADSPSKGKKVTLEVMPMKSESKDRSSKRVSTKTAEFA